MDVAKYVPPKIVTYTTLYLLLVMGSISVFLKIIFHKDMNETFFVSGWEDLSHASHPPVTFLITRVISEVLPHTFGLILPIFYVVLYLIFAIAIVLTWIFSKEFFSDNKSRVIATICVVFWLLLLRNNYYFTPDLFQFLFGTLTIMSSYYVLKYGRIRHWVFLTVFAILAFLSKYHIALSIICAGLPFLFTAEGKKRLRSKEFFFSSLMFLIVTGVHFYNAIGTDAFRYTFGFLLTEGGESKPFSKYSIYYGVFRFFDIILRYVWGGVIILLLFFNTKDAKTSARNFIRGLKDRKLEESFLFSNTIVFFMSFVVLGLAMGSLGPRLTFSNGVVVIIGFVYFFNQLFDKVDLRVKRFKYLYYGLIILFPLVTGIGYFYKNRVDLKQLYNIAISKIEEDMEGEIEYVVGEQRYFDNLYSSFPSEPEMVRYNLSYKQHKAYDKGSKDLLFQELKDKNFVILWKPKQQIPEWVVDVIKHFPNTKVAEPLYLESKQKKILNIIPLKQHKYSFQYAHRRMPEMSLVRTRSDITM